MGRGMLPTMKKALHIGMLHYSCPPVVGGVEEVLGQQASILHRNGHSVSIISGMGEVYTEAFPVQIEGLLGSTHKGILKAHEGLSQGLVAPVRQLTERVVRILMGWSHGLDVLLVHNVLHMPFNLPWRCVVWLHPGIPRQSSVGPTIPPTYDRMFPPT